MSLQGGGSDSYSYSYSSSSGSTDPAALNNAMWAQISRIPVDLLEKTDDFMYIEKVMNLVTKYDFTVDDPHMREPKDTTRLGRLLRLVAAQCSKRIAGLRKDSSDAAKSWAETEAFLKKKIELQNDELAKLRHLASRTGAMVGASTAEAKKDGLPTSSEDPSAAAHEKEVRQLRVENDLLSTELRKLSRTNEELRQSLNARRLEQTQVNGDSDKLYLEYKHLVARHRRLLEKSNRTEEMLAELRGRQRDKRHNTDAELERLRDKVSQLQQENLTLIESRDRAEELCEKREAEALRDMTELRRLTKDLIEEERGKVRQVREDYASLKQEADAHVEELLRQHDEDLRSKEEELVVLRRQLEKATTKQVRHFNDDATDKDSKEESSYSDSSRSGGASSKELSSTATGSGSPRRGRHGDPGKHRKKGTKVVNVTLAERRLERENDELQAEVEELEARIDAIEDENRRLTCLIKDYESGEEGLSHLRHELGDAVRTVDVLQDENAQLRERLNGMEDSLAFTAALQELCKRMGVTSEEINSLKPQNSASYNEMDTLKEELNVLKEEVEWLEKERRHWMNKVRLQPLMDTKLRFELGLTSEQLRQLDNLVDQMKAGNLIVEDEDKTYKERYFRELEARRKDAAQFNDYVKSRIEEALRSAFSGETGGAGGDDTVSALAALKDHIDLLTTSAGAGEGQASINTPAELTRRQLKDQLDSTRRHVEQLTFTNKDNAETIAQLREKLAAATAESEAVAKERDQYRDAVFSAAGIYSSLRRGDGPPSADGPLPLHSREEAAPGGPTAGADDTVAESHASGAPRGAGERDHVPVPKDRLMDFQSKWASISTTLRDQLRSKDEIIHSLHARVADMQTALDSRKADLGAHAAAVESEKRTQRELRDQLSALQEINEDLDARNRELQSINTDLAKGMEGLDGGGKTKELLQKVVLLRRREAKLMARLRRAITAQEEAVASEKKMRSTMDSTLASLRDALEGSSTGFVLPPSSASHNFEEEQLSHIHRSAARLLSGKLFREDSRYLVHLQQVYHTMDSSEEVAALRLRERDCLKRIDTLQGEVDQLKIALVEQQQQRRVDSEASSAPPAAASPTSSHAVAASRWESESVMWRQKYELCYKRLEARDAEVALLEKELDTTREEMVGVKDHVRNILSGGDANSKTELQGPAAPATASEANAGGDVAAAGQLARYEREVARLKSINLGLLQHTLDLQANSKSLEVELEASRQEVALLKDSGNGDLINDFVSAAVHEHAALRRQSELALIQVRRLKVQLAATEANYQVVANEATAYKLSAYRLYRRYVDEMVGMIDYIRCVQRASKGALSPHRAEIMDRRFQRLAAELAEALGRNKMLAADLSDQTSAVTTLEQQLQLARLERGSAERQDALEARLREARAAVRETTRRIAECQEDERHAEGKVRRLEAYVQQLTEELARLELCAGVGVPPLGEELLHNLVHLRETVFAKAEAPPLAVHSPASGAGEPGLGSPAAYRAGLAGGADDPDTAVREYRAAVMKQRSLATQVEELRHELAVKATEVDRLSGIIADQRDMLKRIEEQSAFYQRQLDEDRRKAEAREERVRRAHETQAEVSRRAVEHNAQCLREMVQKKEVEIARLQEQLGAERRRTMEQQLEEASRMERVHENMFRENSAMVERFKVAINSVGEGLLAVQPPLPGDDPSSSSVLDQLRYLTAETIRLQRELETAHATNVVLESQLEQQLLAAQRSANLLTAHPAPAPASSQAPLPAVRTPAPHASSPSPPAAPSYPTGPSAGAGAWAEPLPTYPTAAAPAAPQRDGDVGSTDHTANPNPSRNGGGFDTLTGIIRSQSAMIESLRQREAALSEALQLEKRHHSEAQHALEELRLRHIEMDGALHLVSQVSGSVGDSAPVRELRAQLAAAEQELRLTREQLAQERAAAQRVQADAGAWKAHLDSLQLQVANQQVEVDRARHLSTLNEGMQADLNTLKDQNDKLVAAASMLKQRLMDEARRGGDADRQRQHEVALAQRMGTLQQESLEHVRALDRRVKEVQRELSARVAKEKDMLAKSEDTQRLVYQLHQQLRAKDREIADMKGQLSKARTASPVDGRAAGSTAGGGPRASPAQRQEAGTQVLNTVDPREGTGVTARGAAPADSARSPPPPHPAVAGEAAGSLTAPLAPASAAPPVAAAMRREQHKSQRDTLQQLSLLRSTVGRLEKDLADAREQLVGEREAARQLRAQLQALRRAAEEADAGHARELLELRRGWRAAPAGAGSASAARSAASPGWGSAEGRGRALGPEVQEPGASPADVGAGAPLDIRSRVRAEQSLESTIDDLRRQLRVDAPSRANELQHQIDGLQRVLGHVLADLAAVKGESVDNLRRVYAAPPVGPSAGRTATELEAELLARNNTILDLRFTVETLELRVGRLQRHLDSLMSVDAPQPAQRPPSQRGQADRGEALEAVVDNLQLVIESLQRENAQLAALAARQPELIREVRRLRDRSDELQTQLAGLRARPAAASGAARRRSSAGPAQAARLESRLAAAQASADAYHAELEALRARLEGGERLPEAQGGPAGELPALGGARGFTRPGSSEAPRAPADSSTPPPLPPAPLGGASKGSALPTSVRGPHGSMRHHHLSRR